VTIVVVEASQISCLVISVSITTFESSVHGGDIRFDFVLSIHHG